MSGSPTSLSDLPRRLGPYWLESMLGRGGMGVVYRARDLDSGEVVALKTLEAVDADLLGSLRREILILRRVNHPGVVRVVGAGRDEGIPWYAMELIEGLSFDRYGAPEAASPSSWSLGAVEARLRVLLRLCTTLGFLHGEGIVHRDLKPANVIIRESGDPVLVDFGLVARVGGPFSREPLEVGGEVLGTFDYMSPEQALGDYVDARADLYALGCMLYELLTGAPPFSGGPLEVMSQHIEAAPEPPSKRVAGLPTELDSLALQLLEKQPRRRLAYASDVAAALAACLPGDVEAPGPAAQSYLYRPSFAGRSEQLVAFSERLERASDGPGACILIRGESGVGKTRLAMEATRIATSQGFRVVTGECIPVEGAGPGGFLAAPLHPLRPLLRAVADHCIAGGIDTTERLFGRRAPVLAPYEETLRQVPGFEAHPAPPQLPTDAVRRRLIDDLIRTTRAFASEMPLLVVIDDLQWADETTVAFLAALTPACLEDASLLVLGTYRSDEAREAVRDLSRAEHVRCLDLGRIDGGTVEAIVSDMLALRTPPPALMRFLSEASEGNPFFVSEYLRAAVESGVLRRSEEGEWEIALEQREEDAAYESLSLPRAVRDLLERRIAELGTLAERCLEAAAVLGREFDLELVTALCDFEEEKFLEAIAELLRREVIDEIDGLRCRFSHDKIREAAYARIPDPRRQELHRTAAREIEERLKGDEPERWYGVLAHHWSMAGVSRKSLDYLGMAGAAALRAGAPRDALSLLQRAIGTDDRTGRMSSPLERARWLRMLGEAHAGTGDLESSIERTQEGLATLGRGLPTSGPRWLAMLLVEAGRQLVRRLSGSRRSASDPRRREAHLEAALASGRVATNFYYEFDLLRGTASSLRCINLAERGGSPGLGALSYAQIGYVAGGLRLHGLARRYFGIARDVGGDGDPSAFAAGLYFHAMYQCGLGRWQESQGLASEAVAKLARIENHQESEIAATVLANTLYFRGRLLEADERCQEISDSAERRANAQHAGWGLFLSGRSRLAMGDARAAADLLERGYALLHRVPDIVSLVICEGLLARARLAVGREGDALELADRLNERLAALPRRVVPLVQCLDGYRGLADVYWLMWRREGEGDRHAYLRRMARRACSDLELFARLFPVAAPAAFRARARVDWLEGRRGASLRSWRRAVEGAERLAMPYDEALAHVDLAGAADSESEREGHRQRAETLFERIGCVPGDGASMHAGVSR